MGLIHIYCGDGKGKTTAATGLAVRMLGRGGKVLFVQFVKNGNSSEIKLLQTLDNLNYLNCEKYFGRFSKLDNETKAEAKIYYTDLFKKAISDADKYDMIVFDELVGCFTNGLLEKEVVLDFLANKDNLPEIVLTGRNPLDELAALADYQSEINKIKHPYERGVKARHGIEF